jgi:hypothetical protein
MRDHGGRLDPFEAVLLEWQCSQERRGDSRRVNGRTDIVDKARQRQLGRSHTAADGALGFVDGDLPARLRERYGASETIRSRADHDPIRLRHVCVSRSIFVNRD